MIKKCLQTNFLFFYLRRKHLKSKSFLISLSLFTSSILLFFCYEAITIKKHNLENQKFSIYFISSIVPLEKNKNLDIILEKNSKDINKDLYKFISKTENRNNNEELLLLSNKYINSKYLYVVRTNKKIHPRNMTINKITFEYERNELFQNKVKILK
jgi:hypothetical protein